MMHGRQSMFALLDSAPEQQLLEPAKYAQLLCQSGETTTGSVVVFDHCQCRSTLPCEKRLKQGALPGRDAW
jgi:hypothetical protein